MHTFIEKVEYVETEMSFLRLSGRIVLLFWMFAIKIKAYFFDSTWGNFEFDIINFFQKRVHLTQLKKKHVFCIFSKIYCNLSFFPLKKTRQSFKRINDVKVWFVQVWQKSFSKIWNKVHVRDEGFAYTKTEFWIF